MMKIDTFRNKLELKRLREITKIGTWYLDLESNEVTWSKELYEMYGFDPTKPPPPYTEHKKLFIPESWDLLSESLDRTSKTGVPYELELQTIRQDGALGWMWVRGEAVKDEQEEVIGLWGAAQDITQRKSLEAELGSKNSQLVKLNENLKHANEELQMLNEEITVTNEELSQSFHLAKEKEQELRSHRDLLEHSNERLESLLRISQYKTDNKQELLDYALEEAIMLTHSKIGYIYFYNDQKEQFVLNTWSKEVMKECAVMEPQTTYNLEATGCWGEAVRQKKPIIINNYQEDNPLKKGTPKGHIGLDRFLTIPVIFDDQIVAVAGVANKTDPYNDEDVRQLTLLMDSVWKFTERIDMIKELKTAQSQAEQSDRLKSAFLANMSHEIRTPLNGILGFADLLNEPDISKDELNRFVSIISENGERLLELVNNILDISRIESEQIEFVNSQIVLPQLLRKVEDVFIPELRRKSLSLELIYDPQEQEMVSDRSFIEAILINLIKNAIKFTDKGSIQLGYALQNGQAEFFVKDNGIGIPKEKHDSIFDRFHRDEDLNRKNVDGAGLGLSICKSYVEMLGGRIWVDSEPGKGSTFRFSIPSGLN